MQPPIVVLVESEHFPVRLAQARNAYPDAEKIVLIVRSASGPALPEDRTKLELHRVNEFNPPAGRRIKLIVEPTNLVESFRQCALWARRYKNNLEVLLPTGTGSFESAGQVD